MMKFFLLIALFATINAFHLQNVRVNMNKLQMASSFDKEIGAQPPLGFWDPLGVLQGADQERFQLLRKYEVKHGRIAMLAVLGHIVTAAGYRVGGNIAYGLPYSSMKAGLGAFETIPAAGIAQIVIFIGLLEWGFEFQQKNIEEDCKQRMTDFGWNEKVQANKAAIELNNGRAAQMGILGLMVHEKIDGNAYILNSLLGAPVHLN